MQTHLSPLVLAGVLCLPAPGLAQNKYLWSPSGADQNLGGSNNTIPFWSQSATYQQIHSKEDLAALNRGGPVFMKGMAMRPWGTANRAFTGRSWDLKLWLNHTQAVGTAASTVFATNLGTSATQVFGSTSAFTTFTWQSTTSIAGINPPAWTIPFTQTFIYIPTVGNLCWEWRHLNATSVVSCPMDATAGSAMRGTAGSQVGTGCTGSLVSITFPYSSTTGYGFQIDLTGAASNASALIAIGLVQQSVDLGWCGKVELTPAALLPVVTSSAGGVTLAAPLTVLQGLPRSDVLFQFAWNDSKVKGGVGLSAMAPYKTPVMPGAHAMARIWNSTSSNTSNGQELATTGTVGNFYGLVVGWLQ